MNKKTKENIIIRKIVLTIGILSIFTIIFLSSLFSMLYNLNYYDKKYEQYGVYNIFSKERALNATQNLFSYFQDNQELDMKFYNEQEKNHLYDVKILLQNAKLYYYLGTTVFWIMLILYYLFNRKELTIFFSSIMLYSGIFTVSAIIILNLIFLLTNFDFLFLKFHEMFFTGNYAFDPAVSNMKSLFPDIFFRDIGLNIILKTFLKGLVLIVTGHIFMKKFK